jgi:hypothetical protein
MATPVTSEMPSAKLTPGIIAPEVVVPRAWLAIVATFLSSPEARRSVSETGSAALVASEKQAIIKMVR